MSGVQSREAFAELVARIDAQLRHGNVPEPPDSLDNEQRTYFKELVNRVKASGASGVIAAAAGAGPLAAVPNVPSNPDRITRDMLERLVRWKMEELTGQTVLDAEAQDALVDFAADWNPSLHPRGPDGKFIERPWNIDLAPGDIDDTPTHGLVEFLGDTPGEPDMDAILSDDGIRIDGIPDDVDSVDELKDRIENPQTDMDVPANPNTFNQLETGQTNGDIIRMPGGDPAKVLQKHGDGHTLTVERPDGSGEQLDMNTVSRNTVDVYDVDSMRDLPSVGGTDTSESFDISELDPDHPAFESTMDLGGSAKKGDILKVRLGESDEERRRADDILARVTEVEHDGLDRKYRLEVPEEHADTGIMEQVPGNRILVERGENARVSAVFNPPGFDLGNSKQDWTEITPDDPEDGEWLSGDAGALETGEIVKFNSPRTMSHEVARVTSQSANRGVRVETPDGERFRVANDEDRNNGVWELTGVFNEGDVLNDPDSLPTVDDIEERDLTEMDGTPEERRRALAGEFVGEIPQEAVENEEIPEGVVIAKDRPDEDNPHQYEVLGYEDGVTGKELKILSNVGRERTISADIANERYQFYEPADKSTVSIPDEDWGGEDDPLADRSRAIKSVLDDVVTTPDGDPAGNPDDELDEETFEDAKEQMARHLARAKDKEHAERMAAKFTSIGEIGRAHANIEQSVFGETTSWISVSEDEDTSTIVHELGHSVGMVYGYHGGKNDMDKETHPMPDFSWQSPRYDVTQKYGLKPRPGHEEFDENTAVRNQDMLGLDKWKDEVESEVGTGLDGRNFTSPDSEDDVVEGGMVRFTGTQPGLGEPDNWAVVEREGNKVTLEDRSGRQVTGEVESGGLPSDDNPPRINWNRDAPFSTFSDVDGKRKSIPDNWRENPPDPDEYLGKQSFDNNQDAMDHLAEMVSKSWYRQAAASREHYDDLNSGGEIQKKYAIKSGYSAKQAHETWSRIHEVMRPQAEQHPSEAAEAAYTLGKYHPDLLEAYRQVYDIPNRQKSALNAVFEQEGVEFRFDDVVSMTPPGDVDMTFPDDLVREKYNKGEFQ